MMRIITGSARGTHLFSLQGDNTRPTSERAKEAVFSMLGERVVGTRVLDLFAGSGQMGLEALSRGAEAAVLVDAARAACDIVRKNAEKTRLLARATLHCGDALSFLRAYRGPAFDLVFLDPPYAAGLLPQCLSLLCGRGLLCRGALIVAESAAPGDVFGGDGDLSGQFEVLKQNRYGVAHVSVLTPKEVRE